VKTPIPYPAPEILSPLAALFQDLRETLNDFSTEAAELHKSVSVSDDTSQAIFSALSRITAYSDQLQMVLALMGEDVRVAEEIGMGPTPQFDTTEHENYFYEWLRSSRKGGVAVN
jgi:hypothetical protein